MDVPNTGAIFTLGKSHLAENTQSYFYIKNDPIKRLIAGPHQSAVICGNNNYTTKDPIRIMYLVKILKEFDLHFVQFIV